MNRTILVAGFFMLLCLPYMASAKQGTTATWNTLWDFRDAKVPGGDWERAGLTTVQPTDGGLLIDTARDGRFSHRGSLGHPIHAMRLTFGPSDRIEASLRWHVSGTAADAFFELPFLISGSDEDQIVDLDLKLFGKWDPQTDLFGLVFPAGTAVMMREMDLRGWSGADHMSEALRSFWTFDAYKPTSINFLWGPMLTTTDLGRIHLFENQPPRAENGSRLLYYVLFIAGIFIVAMRLLRHRLFLHPVRIFLGISLALWILFDLRMGLETLSYARADYQTYISQKPGERTLRNYENFYQVVDRAAPHLRDQPSFVFVTPDETAFLSAIRYFLYPSIAVPLADATKQERMWLVFRRPDVSVDAQGRLVIGANAVTGPGTIVKRFDETSFLFAVQ